MRLAPAKPLADLVEKELQQQVVSLFRACGWHGYHTHDSRRSQPGFPDIVLIRERVIYLELKTEKGHLSDRQREWLRALLNAGAEVYLVRPRHLDMLARLLAHRGEPWLARGQVVDTASVLREELRQEIG